MITSKCLLSAAGLAAVLSLSALAQEVQEAQEPPYFLPWQEIQIRVGNDHDGFLDSVQGRVMYANPEACQGYFAMPYISRVPGESKYMLMFSGGQKPNHARLVESTDECESWTPVATSDLDWIVSCWGLTCCGNGRVLALDGALVSDDSGSHWKFTDFTPDPHYGQILVGWDPILVDPKSNGKHLYNTCYILKNFANMEMRGVPLIRESFDGGETWGERRPIPEFLGSSEVALAYNAKGEILAGVRGTTITSPSDDQEARLECSYSTDGGKSWAPPKVVAGNGRHHPSMALLPDGRVVMTYVVRTGYPMENGKYAYGIEAVISYDDGHTWDTDHRYLLAHWTHDCILETTGGEKVQLEHYWGGPQCTSTHYLPESDCLVTAYGTLQNTARMGVRGAVPSQIAMVKWRPIPRDEYTAEKASPPAPPTADEALAKLRHNPYWSVNYVASIGEPDCGWHSHYADGPVSQVDGWLRLDHRNYCDGAYCARGTDHIERINWQYGLKARLNVPEIADDGHPHRLHIKGLLGTGQDKCELFLVIDENANLIINGQDALELPTHLGTPFLLEAYFDNVCRHLFVWVDGQLVADREYSPKYVAPETPASFHFGAWATQVGGVVEIGELKFGAVKY